MPVLNPVPAGPGENSAAHGTPRTRRSAAAPGAKRSYKPAAERRAEILRHALECFAERGYHATSIADVCARSGIGRATLYQYFDDKRALLVALADALCERVLRSPRARAPIDVQPGSDVPEELLVRFVESRYREVLGVVFEDAPTARLMLRAGRGADGVVDGILARIDAVMLSRMERELAVAMRAGLLRDIDPAIAARFLLGGIEKLTLSYLEEGRPLDLDTITREATRLQLFGILPRPTLTSPGDP